MCQLFLYWALFINIKFKNMIIFQHRNGKWINFTEKGIWVLSNKIDYVQAGSYIPEYVNEIMDDLKCKLEDIEIIETDGLM